MTRPILLLLALLIAAPLFAQDQTGPQGGAAGNPAGAQESTDTRNIVSDTLDAMFTGPAWNLGISLYGGYSRSNLPQVDSASSTLTSLIRSGGTAGASTRLSASFKPHVGLFGFGGSTSTHYFRSTGRLFTSFSGQASQSFQVGQRGHLSAGQAVAVAPFYALGQFQALQNFAGTQLTMPTPSSVNTAIGDMRQYRYSGSVRYSQTLTDRTGLSGYYTLDASALTTPAPQFYNQSGGANLSHRLTQSFGIHLGYGYAQLQYSGVSQKNGYHYLNAGVDLNRGLSITRRAKLNFSTGTTLNRTAALAVGSVTPSTSGSQTTASPTSTSHLAFNLIGQATLSYDLGRTWIGRVNYGRSWQVIDGTYVPYLGDGISGGLSGSLGPNVSLGLNGSYILRIKQKSQTTNQSLPNAQAAALDVFMNMAFTNAMSGFVQFGYYQQQFDLAQLGLNLPGALTRQAVRGGISIAFRSR